MKKPASNTYKKKERLKSKKEIERVFKSRQSFKEYPLVGKYRIEENPGDNIPLKMAVIVPKRLISSAVDRNLVKRRIREAYRKNKVFLQEDILKAGKTVHLLLILTGEKNTDYSLLEDKIILILNRLRERL